ncbi:MAG: hypothetical protein H0V70_18745 [Ktedonobacteraceae bacterium]|nr:hypothetical protein [Ktedonobacteraceae bacterium]
MHLQKAASPGKDAGPVAPPVVVLPGAPGRRVALCDSTTCLFSLFFATLITKFYRKRDDTARSARL